MNSLRVGIVGAGIVGLAYAWSAVRRGHHVSVLERHPRASGASIRNFGMIWPIGQPAGQLYDTAMASRERWLELSRSAGVWVNPCGSLHLAYHDDELTVLREFAAAADDLRIACEWIGPAEVIARSPAANPTGLLGGLASSTELCVNPRTAVDQIAAWLRSTLGVQFHFDTLATSVQPGTLCSADSRRWDFDRIIVCGGADIDTLFPACNRFDTRLCKLQMLRTGPQPAHWKLGPHIAGGLTLRHYRSFEVCPSLASLKQRIADQTPELDRFGIHVMASQNELGHVILGDSHEYDGDVEPFDKEIIDQLILRELRTIIRLPQWSVAERWHGRYAKHPELPIVRSEPLPEVHVRTGTGGAGMTLALGLAEADWNQWSQ